ncbi:hypothetical protein ABFX02_09G010000 [Erythranthe guttata]
MEEVQTSSSGTVSHETHSTPTVCEFDTSFNSLQSTAATKSTTTAEVNVFDLTTLSLADTFGSGYSGSVKSIAFSKGRIFTAHQDCKIRVWQKVMTSSSSSSSSSSYSRSKQFMKHRLIQTLPTFKDRFFNFLSPKNYVRIRRNEHKLRIEHADAVSALAVNNDVALMYSVSWDKSFKIWNVSSSDMPCLDSVNEAHADAVNAVAVDPTDGTVYTGSANGEIKVWKVSKETKKHKLLTTLAKHASSVNALALTIEGSIFLVCVDNGVVISGSSDKSVRIWKYEKGFVGGCLAVLEGHCKPVKSLVLIPGGGDGFSVFSGSMDGEIRAWKIVLLDCNSRW